MQIIRIKQSTKCFKTVVNSFQFFDTFGLADKCGKKRIFFSGYSRVPHCQLQAKVPRQALIGLDKSCDHPEPVTVTLEWPVPRAGLKGIPQRKVKVSR